MPSPLPLERITFAASQGRPWEPTGAGGAGRGSPRPPPSTASGLPSSPTRCARLSAPVSTGGLSVLAGLFSLWSATGGSLSAIGLLSAILWASLGGVLGVVHPGVFLVWAGCGPPVFSWWALWV